MRKKILIIDHDKKYQEKYYELLTPQDYQIIVAENGEDGIIKAVNEKPHLILMDWLHPEKDAVTVAKTIRNRIKNYFYLIMMVSNKKVQENKLKSLELFDEYLEKPFDHHVFLAKVKRSFRVIKTFHMLAYMYNQQKQLLDDKTKLLEEVQAEKIKLESQLHQNEKELYKKDQRLLEHSERLADDLDMASHLQHELVPKEDPVLSRYRIISKYEPMHQIGGDFYDFIDISERRHAFIMSDVSGHGIAAAFITSMLKTAITNYKQFLASPKKMLYILNHELTGRIQEHYVTCVYGVLDLDRSILHYATAGHPPILVWRKRTNVVEEHATQGVIVGLMEGMTFPESEILLEPGDRILIYTDGIYEVFNEEKEELSIPGVKEIYKEVCSTLPLDKVIDGLLDRVNEYSALDYMDDDVAIILIEVRE